MERDRQSRPRSFFLGRACLIARKKHAPVGCRRRFLVAGFADSLRQSFPENLPARANGFGRRRA
jgi:hypothetical protein